MDQNKTVKRGRRQWRLHKPHPHPPAEGPSIPPPSPHQSHTTHFIPFIWHIPHSLSKPLFRVQKDDSIARGKHLTTQAKWGKGPALLLEVAPSERKIKPNPEKTQTKYHPPPPRFLEDKNHNIFYKIFIGFSNTTRSSEKQRQVSIIEASCFS